MLQRGRSMSGTLPVYSYFADVWHDSLHVMKDNKNELHIVPTINLLYEKAMSISERFSEKKFRIRKEQKSSLLDGAKGIVRLCSSTWLHSL